MSIQGMTDEATLALAAAQANAALYEARCARLRKRVDDHHRRADAALMQIAMAVHMGDIDEPTADNIRKALATNE